MKKKMFFFISLKIKVLFMRFFLNILGGVLVAAPIVLTIAIVGLVANWILPFLQYLSPLVPKWVSILITVSIIWALGQYRKKINKFIDKPLSAIPAIGFIYKFFNSLTESLEDFLNKIKKIEGNIVFVPRTRTSYPELGYLMGDEIIWLWDENLKTKEAYLSVNFAALPGLRGNNPLPVPKKVVDGFFENHKIKITIDEAIQYYASLGVRIPRGLVQK